MEIGRSSTERLRFLAWFACGVALMLTAPPGAEASANLNWGRGVKALAPASAGPNPGTVLNSVACPAAGNCAAVGTYTDSKGHRQGLLVTQTSGSWKRGVQALLPADAGSNPITTVTSVACGAPGSCAAVGSYTNNPGHVEGVLFTEVSGAWKRGIKALLPKDARSNPLVNLTSVACPAAGKCTAVGSYEDNATTEQGLLLTETSGKWKRGMRALLPTDAGSSPFGTPTSVSCPTAGNCAAVGTYFDSSDQAQGLLLTETSGSWKRGIKAQLPADAASQSSLSLDSVACPAAGKCTAVGNYRDSSGSLQGLLLSETAGAWARGVKALLPLDAGSNANVFVYSVACQAPGKCAAVGSYLDGSFQQQGLLLSETSGAWARGIRAPLPLGAGSNPLVNLNSVACPPMGKCAAVGNYNDSSGYYQGLLLTKTSASWAPVKARLPAGAGSNPMVALSSVSCPAAGKCTAVGNYTDSTGERGLMLSSS